MIPITKLTSEATPLEVPKKKWLNLGRYFQFGPIIKKKSLKWDCHLQLESWFRMLFENRTKLKIPHNIKPPFLCISSRHRWYIGQITPTLSWHFKCNFSALADGTIVDNQQLICLYMLSQLLERELVKCLRLVEAIPMDMSSFNGRYKQFSKHIWVSEFFSGTVSKIIFDDEILNDF